MNPPEEVPKRTRWSSTVYQNNEVINRSQHVGRAEAIRGHTNACLICDISEREMYSWHNPTSLVSVLKHPNHPAVVVITKAV